MKAGTSICIAIVLVILVLQDVYGGKTVTDKKLDNWGKKKIDEEMAKNDDLKNDLKLNEHGDDLENLIEVIQYVISNAINNNEFRMFMTKRFLHNYVPQVTQYLNKIKSLKKEMNPKEASKDDKKDKNMRAHKKGKKSSKK